MNALTPDTLIRNPQGCTVIACVDINADADKVWQMVGN